MPAGQPDGAGGAAMHTCLDVAAAPAGSRPGHNSLGRLADDFQPGGLTGPSRDGHPTLHGAPESTSGSGMLGGSVFLSVNSHR
jgi:hypothetical protein